MQPAVYVLHAGRGFELAAKNQVLTREAIVRLVGIGVRILGVRELRLTGGEPLVRADLVQIISDLRAAHPDLPIALTTNALGLDKKGAALREGG